MKKFIIKIKYSWGDEEEPILINSNNKTVYELELISIYRKTN